MPTQYGNRKKKRLIMARGKERAYYCSSEVIDPTSPQPCFRNTCAHAQGMLYVLLFYTSSYLSISILRVPVSGSRPRAISSTQRHSQLAPRWRGLASTQEQRTLARRSHCALPVQYLRTHTAYHKRKRVSEKEGEMKESNKREASGMEIISLLSSEVESGSLTKFPTSCSSIRLPLVAFHLPTFTLLDSCFPPSACTTTVYVLTHLEHEVSMGSQFRTLHELQRGAVFRNCGLDYDWIALQIMRRKLKGIAVGEQSRHGEERVGLQRRGQVL